VTLGAAGLVAWLVWFATAGPPATGERPGAPVGGREPAPVRAAPAPARGTEAAATGEPAPPLDGEADAETLRSAVMAADAGARTDADILEAERLLARVLARRPDLAAALAGAFADLRERRLAFAVARLLGRHLRDARVRAALLAALREGDEVAREMAAYAFRGVRADPDAALALAAGFGDPRAPDSLREAHVFALSPMLDDLAADERARAVSLAREIVAGDRPAGAALRAEAVDLLDARGADRARLREVLAGTPDRALALAAARALLAAGEPEPPVRRALARFGAADAAADPTGAALRALLEERR